MIHAGCARRGTWAAGGLATALLLLWAVAGDAAAITGRRGDPQALRLLRDAATAARETPYEGLQFVTSWSGEGAATSLLTVSHTPGGGTLLQVRQTAAQHGGRTYRPDTADLPAGGLTGFSSGTLDLLARNYTLVRAADGSICGRPARVVEARRSDGTPAGRFWLDRETGLMLHRELLDGRGRAVNTTGFYDLRITREAPRAVSIQAAGAVAGRRLGEADLGALRRAGWPVPASLPGRLSLQDARRSEPGSVLHLTYSDGLAAVSLFVQRGRLSERTLNGWRRTKERGRTVFRRDAPRHWTVWAGSGYVYTVLTDDPQPATGRIIAALPAGAPGFWARMRFGAARLGSWLNPFG